VDCCVCNNGSESVVMTFFGDYRPGGIRQLIIGTAQIASAFSACPPVIIVATHVWRITRM